MDEQKSTEEVVNPAVAEVVAPTTKPEMTVEEIEKLKKQKEFFFRLRQGGYFFKFIYKDIERQKKDHCNRAQRRRFEKEMRKGVFSRELVDVYLDQIEKIESFIEEQLNPKAKAPEIDGAEFYKNLKEQEAQNKPGSEVQIENVDNAK